MNGSAWGFVDSLKSPSEKTLYDQFGTFFRSDSYANSFAANDNELFVGAPFSEDSNELGGTVYRYLKSDAGSWERDTLHQAENLPGGAGFGFNIALSRNNLLVSAPFEERLDSLADTLVPNAGRIYTYRKNYFGEWDSIGVLEMPFLYPNERAGQSLEAWNNYSAVGLRWHPWDLNEEDSIHDAGAIYTFQYEILKCPDDPELLVYPSPNDGNFTVCSDSLGIGNLSLFNALGQRIPIRYRFETAQRAVVQMRNDISSGVYILLNHKNGVRTSRKFVMDD